MSINPFQALYDLPPLAPLDLPDLIYVPNTSPIERRDQVHAATMEAMKQFRDEKGQSLLHHAAEKGSLELLDEYIDAVQIPVNATDSKGNTPLHLACLAQKTEVVASLLDKGADVHLQNTLGETSLHYAVRLDNEELARSLLSAGASSRQQNNIGDTPLHVACVRGSATVAHLLFMEYAADPCQRNFEGFNPLHLAAAMDKTLVFEKLLTIPIASVNTTHERNQEQMRRGVNLAIIARRILEQSSYLRKLDILGMAIMMPDPVPLNVIQVAEEQENENIVNIINDFFEKKNLMNYELLRRAQGLN